MASQHETKEVTNPQAYYYFLRGYLEELANDPVRAIEEYRRGVQIDPDSTFLKTRIAKLHFSKGEMAAAVTMADEVPLADVRQVSDLLELGKIYSGTGQSEKALLCFDRAIEREPTHARGYISKGMLLLSLKQFASAKAVLEEAVGQVPDSAEAYYYLGVSVTEENELVEAERYFEKAVQLRPYFRRAYLTLANLYEQQGKKEKAIALYERYLEQVNPHHRDFRLQLVRLYLGEQSFDKALDQLARIREDAPDDLNARVRVALVYGQMGKFQQAIDELRSILQARPNELRVRDYLGLMYEEMKDYDQAAESYQANLTIDSTYYDSLLHLGFLRYRLKEYDEAISHLDQANDLNPKRTEPYLLLGLIYLQNEQYLLATERFLEGIEQDPNNADLHFNLGTAYDKLDRFDDVVREMERTLEIEPEHADALNYLGYSYADRGVKVEQAVQLTQRAVALKPNNGYYVDSLGWALFKIGRSDEALAAINRAISLVSDDPVVFEHLGEIHLQRQELDKAQEAWARSIELDSANERLIKRFRDEGFGNPVKSVQSELPKISHSTSEERVSP